MTLHATSKPSGASSMREHDPRLRQGHSVGIPHSKSRITAIPRRSRNYNNNNNNNNNNSNDSNYNSSNKIILIHNYNNKIINNKYCSLISTFFLIHNVYLIHYVLKNIDTRGTIYY